MERTSSLAHRKLPRARLLACLGALTLATLALGGCAASTPPAAMNSAALAQRAYAENATIRSVSQALDQRVDLMLAAHMAEATP